MHIKHWVLLLILTTTISQWASGSGYGCQPHLHQKGIPVGNNNYQGKDCTFVKTTQTQNVILIHNDTITGAGRTIANEEDEIESADSEDNSGYDYGEAEEE